jgi:hypothetical protein
MAASFGALLTELRENSRLIQDQQFLVQEVEMEMILSNHSNPYRAYAAVMKRRERPTADDDFAEAYASSAGEDRGPETGEEGPGDADGFDDVGTGHPERGSRGVVR